MRKNIVYSLVLVFVLLGVFGLAFRVQRVQASGTIYIRADGNIEGTTYIVSGDNITYVFTADINDSIVVERSNIIVDGNGHTLNGSGYLMYGFNLTSVSNVTIRNANVTGFGYGIYLQSSTLNIILNNNITFNEGNIYLGNSSDNTITGNTITNGAEAIQLYASSNNTISGNSLSDNYYGVWARFNSAENVISENNITHSNRGIFLDASSNNTMSGNRIAIIFEGIAVNNSLSNIITGNRITQAYRGVFMDWFSRYNTITRNSIDNNTRGIHVQLYSSYNTVVGNNITRNSGYGVFLFINTDSTFFHNNFLGNAYHVGTYLPSVHVWNDGVEGNYWSNYTGVDLNHDGIGDTPHVIDANNTDHYPLMGMFHSFNTSLGKSINVISNSSVSGFMYESPGTIRFHVSNKTVNQTYGFCRVCVPYEVLSDPFNVTIDGANPTYWNYTLYDNGTHSWIYFEYEHSTREIVIIPEFPSLLLLPLFMIATLLVAIVYMKKTNKSQRLQESYRD